MGILARAERRLYLEIKKARLKNKTPTIISNNCVGGYICHDMGLRFNSPMVNIGMDAPEYIKFLQDMDKYLNTPMVITERKEYGWPVADWGDIWILFAHNENIEDGMKKFQERLPRINKENMFITMADCQNCSYEDLVAFDRLPYRNKVVFTHKPYPEIKSAFYIRGFEDRDEVGTLSDFRPGFPRRRWIDQFDYVRFLNGKGIKK